MIRAAAASGGVVSGAGMATGPVLLVAALAVGLALVLVALRHRATGHRHVVVDGSNVLHWAGGAPSLAPLAAVLRDLERRGLRPVVWFDANAGYRVGGRYLGSDALARSLGLPERQVFVAPKGTPADPLLLRAAEVLQAPVVSNDRFRGWEGQHPLLGRPGRLIRGRVAGGAVELDWPDCAAVQTGRR
jgi:hypothetical protein